MKKAGVIFLGFLVGLSCINAMDDRDNQDDVGEGGNVRFIPDRYDEGQIRCMRRLMRELLQRAQGGGRRALVDLGDWAEMENDVDGRNGPTVLNRAVWEEAGVHGDDSDE